MAENFAGKTVLITGASGGIGAALALAFAKLDANLVLNARKQEKLEKVKNLCVENGSKEDSLTLVVGDITDETIQKQFIDTAIKTFGRIDVLINNAGMTDAPRNGPLSLGISHFDEILNLNLRAPVALSLLAIEHLRKTKGNIVNISSIASVRPILFRISYNTTKAGLDMFTKTFAFSENFYNFCNYSYLLISVVLDVAKYGVRVNSVNPGLIPTNFGRHDNRDDSKKLEIKKIISVLHPLGRMGTLKEVTDAVLFLASDKSSFTTGQLLFIDGGAAVGGIGTVPAAVPEKMAEIHSKL